MLLGSLTSTVDNQLHRGHITQTLPLGVEVETFSFFRKIESQMIEDCHLFNSSSWKIALVALAVIRLWRYWQAVQKGQHSTSSLPVHYCHCNKVASETKCVIYSINILKPRTREGEAVRSGDTLPYGVLSSIARRF